jgi:methyl-accepting chemotaxis protein
MLESLRNIRIKTFCNVLIAAMIIAGAVVAVASLSTIREVNSARTAWEAYVNGPGKKEELLLNLRNAIGFGGLNTAFKKAIVEKNGRHLDAVAKQERNALDTIAAYRNLGAGQIEINSLGAIEKVVREFGAAAPRLKELIAGSQSLENVEDVIGIHDEPAIEAFDALSKELSAARHGAEAAVYVAVNSSQYYTYLTLITVGVLVVTLILLFLWFARSRLIRPLYELMEFVNRVGNGDLTRQMSDVAKDEVGALAARLNEMVASLKEITVQTRQAVNNLNSAAAETLASTKQQTASVAQQFAALQETTATVDEITQSGEQMSSRAREIAGQAEKASERSKDGLRSMDDLAKIMDAIEEQTEAVAEHIVALSERTQAISEIIATVNDIAERSQLLALNASIEAAAAGEHGRSFAVVAEEIKTLADQAKAATTQVSSILGDIQKGINSSVMSTEESVKRVSIGRGQAENTLSTITDLVTAIEKSVHAFEQVVASTNQQRVGLEQVSKALAQIRTGSEQTAAGTKQIEQAVSNLNSLGNQLDHTMERYAV